MGLEAVTWVSDLVATNPIVNDDVSVGDDHIRNLKTALRTTFPNAGRAFYFPTVVEKTANFSIVIADFNKTFLIITSGSSIIATLPVLASGDSGWICHFLMGTGTNSLRVTPANGTLTSGSISGVAFARRAVRNGIVCSAIWSGSAWFVTRTVSAQIGSVFDGGVLSSYPIGYELASGAAMTSADHPEYVAVCGTSLPDRRGRVAVHIDGGTGRLSSTYFGGNPDVVGVGGGSDSNTLTIAKTPAHDHPGSTYPNHAHNIPLGFNGAAGTPGTSSIWGQQAGPLFSFSTSSDGGGAVTLAPQGGGEAHANVQPTVITNMFVVVE